MRDDFLQLDRLSTVSGRVDATELPTCAIGLEEFCQRLVDSDLMDRETVNALRARFSAADVQTFATQLIEDQRLTQFQANVLLEGQDIPLVIDRYVLLSEIGKGGMGTVYKALHRKMQREVAVKFLPKESVDSPEKVRRFHREVKASAKLDHENIVTAHDATESKGIHFLVMSYIPGKDLAKVVQELGPVSSTKAIDFITQTARGLGHAHKMGVVHRDIKPSNLLLNEQGQVKILDMGLAQLETGSDEATDTQSMKLTQAGVVMGTVAYLAPEQALDTRQADARSDIYSLGCTLYYLLTGKVVYQKDSLLKTILAHREAAIPSLRDERPNVPIELDAIFQKMVAKDPGDRFQSMAELINILDEVEVGIDQDVHPVAVGDEAFQDTATLIDTSRVPVERQASQRRAVSKSRRYAILALAIATFVLVAGIVYSISTNQGTIVVEAADESIASGLANLNLVVEKGNRTWTINPLDTTTLPAGNDYSARLSKDSGLTLIITDDRGQQLDARGFKIRRNGTVLAKVTALATVATQAGTASSSGESELTPASNSEKNFALKFDGLDDFVFVRPFSHSAAEPITFEATVLYDPTKENESQGQIVVTRQGSILLGPKEKLLMLLWHALENRAVLGLPGVKIQAKRKYHLAACWDGKVYQFFIDGRSVSRQPFSEFPQDAAQEWMSIGGHVSKEGGNGSLCFPGVIDEVRVSSVARYTDEFVPLKRFEKDEHTLALYHFDEGNGDVVKDASGNGHDGKIVGAQWVRVDDSLRVVEEE